MLNCVYRLGAERQCSYVDVPPPVAPAFQRIRDVMDLRKCVAAHCYYDVPAVSADDGSSSAGATATTDTGVTPLVVTSRAAFIPLPETWIEEDAIPVQKRLKISLVCAPLMFPALTRLPTHSLYDLAHRTESNSDVL
jgi:hypothetical protein